MYKQLPHIGNCNVGQFSILFECSKDGGGGGFIGGGGQYLNVFFHSNNPLVIQCLGSTWRVSEWVGGRKCREAPALSLSRAHINRKRRGFFSFLPLPSLPPSLYSLSVSSTHLLLLEFAPSTSLSTCSDTLDYDCEVLLSGWLCVRPSVFTSSTADPAANDGTCAGTVLLSLATGYNPSTLVVSNYGQRVEWVYVCTWTCARGSAM